MAATGADRPLPVVLVVAVALVDVDGRVLLAERPAGKPMAGLWEFPGGKVRVGETPEAALIRELKEELGIDVTASCLAPFTFASHAYEDFHLVMPLYVCRRWQGMVMPHEGQRLTATIVAVESRECLFCDGCRLYRLAPRGPGRLGECVEGKIQRRGMHWQLVIERVLGGNWSA